jgi:glyoxylase-like metal-dependent hydrolase (beta-lactamase superfamily II)
MTLLQGDRELLPGISVRVYPGHTANMQAVIIESQGKKACYISDLIPTTHHLDVAWGMGFDLYPLDTLYSKKKFYADAVKDNWLVLFTHDPKVPAVYVEQSEDGKYAARPAG